MPTLTLHDLNASLSSPIYRGSVQNLYSFPGNDDAIISETTSGGSVFDVGTIFDIAGSDTARTGFRHFIFSQLGDPASWQAARAQIEQRSHFKGEKFDTLLDKLCSEGANTHHMGMVDRKTAEVFQQGFPDTLSNLTLIKNFHINKPRSINYADTHFYDYSSYQALDSFVVPLEYIVRFGVTSGSSILNIYDSLQGAAKTKYLSELGQSKPLKAWSHFDVPINDFTTKYEPSDRSISKQEAALISSINGELFIESILLTQLASYLVQNIFLEMGLTLWDLKWEIARQDDALYFVDTIDTDSVRATLKIDNKDQSVFVHFNKQAMRDYYKIMHADWYEAINDAKSTATAEHKTFMQVLEAGQQNNTYPQTPEVDAEFLDIQARKFQYISRYVVEAGQSDDYLAEAKDIAEQEINFYVNAGQYDQYFSLNAC